MKVHVNENIKEVCTAIGALSEEEKKTLLKLTDLIKSMDDWEKQRLLDIGTGMVAMKGHLANGKKEN